MDGYILDDNLDAHAFYLEFLCLDPEDDPGSPFK